MKKTIKLTNRKGEILAAILEFPEGPIAGYSVFAHCFTSNKNLSAVHTIGKLLTDNGIAVLRFDFTGLGESEGEFENTNFTTNTEDLLDACAFLKANYEAPKILIGHSLGGAAVLFSAKHIESLKAILTIGAPADPSHVSHLFEEHISSIEKEGEKLLSIGGRSFRIKKQFLDDIQSKKIEDATKGLNVPIMVIHSPQDEMVEISNAAKIYKAANHPKNFISLDNADHLLGSKIDSQFVGQMISSWTKRYLN